jgi:hypothetical protein
MAKYDPPMLALHYRVQNHEEDYLHQIPVDIKQGATANQLYEELIVSHKAYIGPKTMRKAQVLKLLGKIIDSRSHKNVTFNSHSEANNKLLQSPIENPVNNDRDDANYELDFEDLEESAKEQKIEDKENDNIGAEEKIVINDGVEIKTDSENEGHNDSGEKAQEENLNSAGDRNDENIPEGEINDEEIQKVFVEELGKEVLMDKQGNLFDLEGNFIGKAEDNSLEDENNSDRNGQPNQFAKDI